LASEVLDREVQGTEKEGGEMTEEREVYLVRFNGFHRIMHVFVMLSFLGLAVTGLPLKYSDSPWAHHFVSFFGGFEAAGLLHRVCALVTFGYFAAHLIYLIYFFKCKSTEPFLAFIVGPNSMVPWIKDVKDLYANMKWFIGLGPKPQFDRWTYWEKFDYWAVFWGVGMIGISGLFLWFPTFFSRFVPGWVLNIAAVVHSDEALLATGFIFIFHFGHTHLRGDKFPLDPVIFTGRITDGEMKEERPVEYDRLNREGRLETLRSSPPSLVFSIMSWIVGFAALIVGIACILLVIGTLR
jgi:thiosulfate reductase cytochrome b subunit